MTNKCIECGSPHKNSGGTGIIQDRCFNCQVIVSELNAVVEAINKHEPIMGKPRKLTITGYKLEKTYA